MVKFNILRKFENRLKLWLFMQFRKRDKTSGGHSFNYSWGLGYVRQISVCLTSSAVILVPFPIVLLLEVLLAVGAVPGSARCTECHVF